MKIIPAEPHIFAAACHDVSSSCGIEARRAGMERGSYISMVLKVSQRLCMGLSLSFGGLSVKCGRQCHRCNCRQGPEKTTTSHIHGSSPCHPALKTLFLSRRKVLSTVRRKRYHPVQAAVNESEFQLR